MNGTKYSPTVLLVEDEAELADVYAEWLAGSYHVLTARSASEAITSMTEDVDVVLLDRQLPDQPGIEVLQRLRDGEYDCKVAMVTAYEPDEDILDTGFDEYITKPVTEHELQSTVRRLLRRRVYSHQIQEYFAVVSQLAAVNDAENSSELVDTQDLEELREKKAELRAELEQIENSFTPTDFAATLRDIEEVDLTALHLDSAHSS